MKSFEEPVSECVTVTVRYLGGLAAKAGAGKASRRAEVSADFIRAAPLLKEIIEKTIGAGVLYSVLLNGRNMALFKNDGLLFLEGDEVNVVPVILGG